jgi:hypothetical protein
MAEGKAPMQFKSILIIDAIVNFALGIVLMIFPNGLMSFLGLPITYEPFYTSVLGAVLFGIALALVIECVGGHRMMKGLGMGGAIAINVCGACVIMLWLVSGRLIISLRGYLVLWILVFVLLLISGIEVLLVSPSTGSGQHDKTKEVEHEDDRS